VQLGAQNVGRHHPHSTGAFTGSVSPPMLQSLGYVRWCLAGHSERRTIFHESDESVNNQLKGIFAVNSPPSKSHHLTLGAVLCVGESLSARRTGLWSTVLLSQLSTCLDGIPALDLPNLVIAYEPVWAIGTGVACKAADASAAHKVIRSFMMRKYGPDVGDRVRIIYGGSVSPENVDNIMSAEYVDGVLVGGASLDLDKFKRILHFVRMPTQEE
jgi:triosephosphate isomerase